MCFQGRVTGGGRLGGVDSRLSKEPSKGEKVDVEFGYLNQYIKQAEVYAINHVLQAAIYTRF